MGKISRGAKGMLLKKISTKAPDFVSKWCFGLYSRQLTKPRKTNLLTSDRRHSYNHPRLGLRVIPGSVSRPKIVPTSHNLAVEEIQTFKEPK